MEFTLYYRGKLRSNGGAKEKQNIRRQFHRQLKTLWSQLPLSDYRSLFEKEDPKENEIHIVRKVNGFTFVPLVSEELRLVAEINITMLRPEPPGSIVLQSGDIDNRIKTLLDALKVPSETTAIPKGDIPSDDENPFFCLVEDDALIIKLGVGTDRLLEPCKDITEVVLLVHVQTKCTKTTWANMGLG